VHSTNLSGLEHEKDGKRRFINLEGRLYSSYALVAAFNCDGMDFNLLKRDDGGFAIDIKSATGMLYDRLTIGKS
jgi:hypothetical protein